MLNGLAMNVASQRILLVAALKSTMTGGIINVASRAGMVQKKLIARFMILLL